VSRPRAAMAGFRCCVLGPLVFVCAALPVAVSQAAPAPVRLFVEGERLWDNGTLARSLWSAPGAVYSGGQLPTMGGVDPDELLRVRLPGTLPPGRYRLFARVWSDSERGLGDCALDLWLGGRMRRLAWTNHADRGHLPWSPPLDFDTARPADVLEVRTCRAEVMQLAVDCLFITADLSESAPPDTVPTGGSYTRRSSPPQHAPATAASAIFTPATTPEVGLSLQWEDGDPCQILLPGQQPALRLSYSATDGLARVVTCDLKVEDYRGRATHSSLRWRIGDRDCRRVALSPAGKGMFRLHATFADDDGAATGTQQLTFAVVWPPPRTPASESVFGGHFYEMLPQIRRAGVQWARLWDLSAATLWTYLEPEPGRWKWQDAQVARLKAQGFELLGMLETAPKWAPSRDSDPGPWLNYVRKVVHRYRGQIRYWELLNEPYYAPGVPVQQVQATARTYYNLLVPTAKAVKEANPDAVLVGPCGPPGEYPNVFDYWRELFRLGALDHLDAISGHFYVGGGVYPLDQDRALENYILQLRRLLAESGKPDIPILDTESGCGPNETFYTGKDFSYGLIGGDGHKAHAPVPYATQAATVARFATIHAYQRVRWFQYALISNYCFSQAAFEKNHAPLPALSSYSNAAHFLSGATPLERLGVGERCPAYVFADGSGGVAVVWAEKLARGERRLMNWAPPARTQAFDLMGNPLPESGRLDLGMEPLYLTAPDPHALVAALKAASVQATTPPGAGAREPGNVNVASPTSATPPQVLVDSVTDGYSTGPLTDGLLASVGEPADCWRSAAGPGPHWVELRWPHPVSFNKVVVGRPTMDATGYVVQVWLEDDWRNVPFTPTFRSSGLGVEPMWLPEYTTGRLRVLQDPAAGRPFAVSEVQVTTVPLATQTSPDEPPQTFSPDPDGYLRDWLVCGPFPSPGGRWSEAGGWDRDYFRDPWCGVPTELTVRPVAGQRVLTTFEDAVDAAWRPWEVYVSWRPAHSPAPILDLGPLMQSELLGLSSPTPERVIAYAFVYVVSRDERPVTLSLGSDDGVRVWLNGKEIANRLIYRSVSPDTDRIACTLQPGANALLVKVNNDIGGHALVARFLDDADRPLTGLTVRLSAP